MSNVDKLSRLREGDSIGATRVHPYLAGAILGVEVGTLSTFFSMQHPELGQCEVLSRTVTESDTARELRYRIRYPDGLLDIHEVEERDQRRLEITALEPSRLMDAVLRFVFPLHAVEDVRMNDELVEWRRKNRYHQKVGGRVRIKLANGRAFRFEVQAHGLPAELSQVTYVRDEPNAWVFHVRCLALRPTETLVRGCLSWYNRPLPDWFQRLWARVPGLARATLYLRERVSQRIPFQTNGAVVLRPGQRFGVSVRWVAE